MKQWKRFFALAVSLILVLQMGSVFAMESDVAAENPETEKRLEFLNAVGILEDSFSDIMLSDRVSRGEFAVAVARIFGNTVFEGEAEPESYYVDMADMGTEMIKAVNLLTDKKILSGTGNGMFEPNSNISFEQAVKIFVCALGYEMVAAEYGGFPGGFLVQGNRLGITGNTSMQGGDALTWEGFISMLYQTLFVDLMETESYGTTPSYVIVKGDTLLNTVMKIQTLEHVTVTGNHMTNLNGGLGVSEGYAEIEGKLYEDPKGFAGNLIGRKADVYYTVDRYDVRRIVYACTDYDFLTVLLEDIEKISGYQITYYDQEARREITARIAEDAVLILNGQAEAYTPNLIDLTKSGRLVLERRESSSVYSVVTAQIYTNMVVDAVDYSRRIIYDKMTDGKPLDLNSYLENERCNISKNGAEIDLNGIAADSILTVYETPNRESISITVSDNKVTGALEYYSTEHVTLNGTSYLYADSMEEKLKNFQGRVFTAYLDIFDRIIWVEEKSGGGLKYGYLIAGAMQGGFADTVMLRVLTEEGSVEEYTVSSRVQLNYPGDDKKIQEVLCPGGKWNQQLIRYALNSKGEIGTVYTESGSQNTDGSDDGNRLECALPKGSYRYKSSGSFYGKAMIDANTKIFVVSPDGSPELKDYQTKEKSYFVNDGNYIVAAYNTDDGGMSEALVCWDEVGDLTPSYRSNSLMVDYISNTIDEEGNEIQELHGYTNGNYVEYVTDGDTELTTGTRELKRGDVIRYVLNGESKIAGITVDVNIDTKNAGNAGFSTFWNTHWAMSGAFYSREKSYAVISNTCPGSLGSIFEKPDPDMLYAVPLSSAKIVIYDEEKDAVYAGTVNDILTYKTAGEGASRFFMRFNYETPKEIFIFKYKN